MTLSSVLKSIQTLFDEDPLQNEPGFEKHGKVRKRSVSEEKYADYAEQVTHANIRISLIMQLKVGREFPLYFFQFFLCCLTSSLFT